MGRLVERLQAAAAQPIDRGARDSRRQPRDEAHDAANIKSLLPLLLRAAEYDVLNDRGINAGPLDDRSNYRRREVVRPHIPKRAAQRMSAANRRATAINDYGDFHVKAQMNMEEQNR
jgi:hypothetical protein